MLDDIKKTLWATACWRRHELDPGCRLPVTHPLGQITRVAPRFQSLCTGSVKVGSVGQIVVGRNKDMSNLLKIRGPVGEKKASATMLALRSAGQIPLVWA